MKKQETRKPKKTAVKPAETAAEKTKKRCMRGSAMAPEARSTSKSLSDADREFMSLFGIDPRKHPLNAPLPGASCYEDMSQPPSRGGKGKKGVKAMEKGAEAGQDSGAEGRAQARADIMRDANRQALECQSLFPDIEGEIQRQKRIGPACIVPSGMPIATASFAPQSITLPSIPMDSHLLGGTSVTCIGLALAVINCK